MPTFETQRLRAEIEALRWALCNVLDGERPHRLAEEFGLSAEDAEVLIKIWNYARSKWLPNQPGATLNLNY